METYQLIRSRRKTVSLTVNERGEAVVRAPFAMPEREISDFVQKHAAWLQKKRDDCSRAALVTFADGTSLRLFGRDYRVCTGRSRVAGDELFLPAAGRERALVRLLKRLTAQEMGEKTKEIAEKFGFRYLAVRVSSARSRWGSCNRKGTIAYSFRVAFLPAELAEYVAVHELCHTRHFDHGKAFWAEVERILPDWKRRRKQLRDHGAVMRIAVRS